MGELLAATIILLLASQVMAEGVTFAVRMYNQVLTRSQGKQLCSTLTGSIETELRYATSITYDENNGELLNYFSPIYGQTQSSFLSIDDAEKEVTGGELAIRVKDADGRVAYQKLISGSAYSSFGLKAKAETRYDKSSNIFTVTLTILDKNNQEQTENRFHVIPVNVLKIHQSNS